jgi:hypothetical protein
MFLIVIKARWAGHSEGLEGRLDKGGRVVT